MASVYRDYPTPSVLGFGRFVIGYEPTLDRVRLSPQKPTGAVSYLLNGNVDLVRLRLQENRLAPVHTLLTGTSTLLPFGPPSVRSPLVP